VSSQPHTILVPPALLTAMQKHVQGDDAHFTEKEMHDFIAAQPRHARRAAEALRRRGVPLEDAFFRVTGWRQDQRIAFAQAQVKAGLTPITQPPVSWESPADRPLTPPAGPVL
jgi:hypothetical protein